MESTTTKGNGTADERRELTAATESVEALQETIAAAHQRLQQRLTEEIEQQRQEANRLRQEVERAKGEADAVLARANETAAKVTGDAKKEADRLVAEAGEAAALKLSQAHETASAMLSRLRDQAGSLFATAAEEMEAVQLAIVAIQNAANAAQGDSRAANDNGAGESVVTRLTVRPNVDADQRARIGDRFDAVSGIDGVKLGEAGEDSFDLLLIHGRDANVAGNLIAVAPEAIRVTAQKPGTIELEVSSLDWLGAGAPTK
jgi:hypothetical protein